MGDVLSGGVCCSRSPDGRRSLSIQNTGGGPDPLVLGRLDTRSGASGPLPDPPRPCTWVDVLPGGGGGRRRALHPRGNTTIALPICSLWRRGLRMLFQRQSSWTPTPNFWAMAHSESPACTSTVARVRPSTCSTLPRARASAPPRARRGPGSASAAPRAGPGHRGGGGRLAALAGEGRERDDELGARLDAVAGRARSSAPRWPPGRRRPAIPRRGRRPRHHVVGEAEPGGGRERRPVAGEGLGLPARHLERVGRGGVQLRRSSGLRSAAPGRRLGRAGRSSERGPRPRDLDHSYSGQVSGVISSAREAEGVGVLGHDGGGHELRHVALGLALEDLPRAMAQKSGLALLCALSIFPPPAL